LQYYLERNLEARERELAREEELEEKAPKVKAKSKMSKVTIAMVHSYCHFMYEPSICFALSLAI
jgi:hypothetical protein